MRLKHHKGFSLLEVMLTVAIMSTVVIFVFRSFASALSGVRFGQNMMLAVFLAQEKISLMEYQAKVASDSGAEDIKKMHFRWNYDLTGTDLSSLYRVDFSVSWKEKFRGEDYMMNIITYFYLPDIVSK